MLACDGLVSVVVPAFDESEHVETNLIELAGTLTSFGWPFEIILVDDGSTDGTSARAEQAREHISQTMRVIRCEEHRGKGAALGAGAAAARGEYVVFLDADLELHPRQLPALLHALLSSNADAVVGSKFHPGSNIVKYPAIRKFYSVGYYWLVKALFGLPLRDTQTGIKAFKAAMLRDVLSRVVAERFAFDVELLVIATDLGYDVAEAPVEVRLRRPFSRIGLRDAWGVLLDTLTVYYRLRVGGSRESRAVDRRSAA